MTISTALTMLRTHIKARKSESAQAALVAEVLAGLGYKAKPEVHALPLERGATARVYLWLDTPFKDALVLVTGPSVAPEVLLGKEIPAEPAERGFYIRGGAAQGKAPERVLDRISRAMQAKVAAIAKTTARREVARARNETPPVVVVAPAPPPPPPPPPIVDVAPPAPRAARAPKAKRMSAKDQKLALLQQGLQNFARAVTA